jgi:hypothetical protein
LTYAGKPASFLANLTAQLHINLCAVLPEKSKRKTRRKVSASGNTTQRASFNLIRCCLYKNHAFVQNDDKCTYYKKITLTPCRN